MTFSTVQPNPFEITDAHWLSLGKSGDAHKYQHGHAGIVSGPSGQGGAARLAARGALRIGAGVVSVICRTDTVAEHAAQLNAIMVKPYSGKSDFLACMTRIKPKAICIGPNLGLERSSQDLLSQALTLAVPLCLDADAITLMADTTVALPTFSNPKSVLTPHEGELRRYIPESFAMTSCRVTLANDAAKKSGCVVLFKGKDTVIVAPNRRAVIVSSARFQNTSWLATAGSGDVLAGFITGLLARGFDPFDAACLAADLHLRCADAFGPGLIAEDIPEILPKILR
mgnify:CR=1 FL=1